MIQVFQPSLSSDEAKRVAQIFATNWIGRGQMVNLFEAEFAYHIGVNPESMIAISNCTAGLFMSMQLLDLGYGDEVVMPTIHFVGVANAVVASGATPVFCDVHPRTLNPSLGDIILKMSDRTRAVCLLHYGGAPCEDIERIAAMCHDSGIFLIEDSACSPASKVNGQSCGTFGDIGLWSFDPMKIMSTIEGGMMWCKNPEHAARARRLINLGLSDDSGFTSNRLNWWEFEVSEAAPRNDMTDVQAAIGLVQLDKLPQFIGRRARIEYIYSQELGHLDWLSTPPEVSIDNRSSHYFYWIQVEKRNELARFLRKNDIYVTMRYYPLHLVKFYNNHGSLPNAEQAAAETLLLPLHQGLSDEDVKKVARLVKRWARKS